MKNLKCVPPCIMLALAMLSLPSAAQEKKEETPQTPARHRVTRIIEVRYVDVERVANLVRPFGVNTSVDRDMKVITVTGMEPEVAEVEEAVKRLDVPPPTPKNIDLTAYLLVASQQADGSANVPVELRDVITQLKSVMSYKSFSLLNTVQTRTRDGKGAHVEGMTAGGSVEGRQASFVFRFGAAEISGGDKISVIRINGLSLNLKLPAPSPPGVPAITNAMTDAVISTDIDVREGQKVVVGKTTFDSPENALILVLTAKVVG